MINPNLAQRSPVVQDEEVTDEKDQHQVPVQPQCTRSGRIDNSSFSKKISVTLSLRRE